MKRGFSLAELSIVLVILGLLAGGIVGGQSLIRAGQVKAMLKDATNYVTAIKTFQLKYDSLPGDMIDATRYWSYAAGTTGNDATCRNASQTGKGTCNGNGDGRINTYDGGVTFHEVFHAWKQLANDGLIGGTYTGKTGAAGVYQAIPGTNVPAGVIENTGYSWWSTATGSVDASWFPTEMGNLLMFGVASTTGITVSPVFKATEMSDIDAKLDDGMPGLGAVRTYKNNSSCVTSTDPAVAKYNKTATAIACNAIMKIDSAQDL